MLRRGVDFDDVVLAIPLGMARHTCAELVADSPAWRPWSRVSARSRPRPSSCGSGRTSRRWGGMRPGRRSAATWSPSTPGRRCRRLMRGRGLARRRRPRRRSRTSAAPWPPPGRRPRRSRPAGARRGQRSGPTPRRSSSATSGTSCRGWQGADGFRWDLLCGAGGATGPDRLDSQHWRANVDPSDRYVQSLPGTDRLRLRAGRQRLRQPGPGRRLDRLRPQRRVHRGGGAVGAPGGQRAPGPAAAGPHPRRAPAPGPARGSLTPSHPPNSRRSLHARVQGSSRERSGEVSVRCRRPT